MTPRNLAMLLMLVLPLGSVSASALEIRVTAEARLEVDVSGAGTVAQVSGALRDDLNRGLPQRELMVQIDARRTGQTLVSRDVLTDGLGRFGLQEELPPGDYEVFVRFDKTDHLESIAESTSLRLDPAEVTVRAFAPAFVYRRNNPAWLSARASAADTPYQGWAEVFVGDTAVGRLEFDASGRGTFDVTPHLSEGLNTVRVRTPGSAYRGEAVAETQIRFAERVLLEARLDERIERLQRGLAVTGTVRDATGPIGGVRVAGRIEADFIFEPVDGQQTIFSDTAVTNADGEFVAFVPGTKLADGVWKGTAEFIPPLGERLSEDAGTVEIDTRAFRLAVSGFGWLAVVLGVLLVLARGGVSLREWFASWRERRAKQARQQAALEDVETIVPVFLDDGPPPSPDPRDDLGGLVWDVWQKRPVPGATVTLYRGEVEVLSTEADAAGRFCFIDLEHGPLRIEVRQHGYIRGNLNISVPHDGRLSNFRLDLVAVPLKIRRLVGSVLEQAVGEDLWGQLSPRQIEERLDGMWPNVESAEDRAPLRAELARRLADQDVDDVALLSALTEVVEESYFSGRMYGEEAFLFARALVLRIRAHNAIDAEAR